ncbi:hypothetical protein Cs7R123_33290 [Catellatospora sp. TT07R-123]|uniref:hypothetical protein n=1 Tax=Catellatospora sp. TT07R-123 TaxID=2733863 RepID=UPI001B0A4CC2|nr:hypothetical protein [Catellatospora sp. TT07R-123]GHJ45987.1 hypothetical protein Cs7R123_33290 [Catellatospora sp. TT07R-123]
MTDDGSSIEDLLGLGHGREPAPEPEERRTRSRAVRWLTLVGFALAWTAAGWIVLKLLGLGMPLPLLFAVAVTVVAVWRMARTLKAPPPPRHAGRHGHSDDAPAVDDGIRLAVTRWQTILEWAHADGARYQRRVHARLAELVDERLRQRHGVTRATEPDRARRLLGDQLWTFLTQPSKRLPSPRELDVIVTALERL